MSYKERENFLSLITSVVVTIPYLIFILNKYQSETFSSEEELKFWATAILLMIPIRIVALIIGYILFAIVRAIVTGKDDDIKDITDERDRLIELKGERNSMSVFTFGVLLAMISVLMEQSLATMFLIIIIGGFIGELIGSLSKLYYYHEGI